MSVHLTDKEIRKYHEHSLTAQRVLTADLHLNECEECAKKLHELSVLSITKRISNLRRDFHETGRLEHDHISYEELEALTDGKLDDVEREIVQSHIELCSQCRKEAEDLRNFRSSFIQEAGQDTGRVIPWHRNAIGIVLRMAGAAAMIAIVVWAATLPMRDRIKVLEAQLKEAKEENVRSMLKNSELLQESKELQTEIAELKGSQSQRSIIASLNDKGSVVSLDKQGNIAGITSASPLFLEMAKDALKKQTVETPAFLAGLIGKQGILLGESNNGTPFELIAPVGTVLIEGRPNFKWKSLKDASGYRVRVYDKNFKDVAASEVIKNTNWIPPNTLQRGETFNWVVTAYVADKEVSSPVPPAPEARFRILDSAQYKQLQQSKQDLTKSHLLAGLAYAQLGLLDDSILEFQQLVNDNPDSPIAKKLLDRVEALRKK